MFLSNIISRLLKVIILLSLSATTLFAQWSEPRLIDSLTIDRQWSPRIALGPQGEVVIACISKAEASETTSVHSYLSTDGGSSFVRTLVAKAINSPIGYVEVDLDRVAFDNNGTIRILHRSHSIHFDIGFRNTHFLLSTSVDDGLSFDNILLGQVICGQTFHTGSLIRQCWMQVGPSAEVSVVLDTCDEESFPYPRTIFYASDVTADPQDWREVPLPTTTQLYDHDPLDITLLKEGDTLWYAFDNTVGDSLSYLCRSTDAGTTFTPLVELGGARATVPLIAKTHQNQTVVLYGDGPSGDDTVLTAQLINDSDWTLSPPFRFGPRNAMRNTPKTLAVDDSSMHLVYVTNQPDTAVAYYSFSGLFEPPGDSTFFLDHTEPELAFDDTGGKYLVTVYREKVYLTTRDVPTSIQSSADRLPAFMLSQNYPNPFNPKTDVRFEISDYGWVKLVVFDVLGREVATVVNEKLGPGTHTRQWDARLTGGQASGFSSGVYFYRLSAGTFVQTKKLVLLR